MTKLGRPPGTKTGRKVESISISSTPEYARKLDEIVVYEQIKSRRVFVENCIDRYFLEREETTTTTKPCPK